jgi:hypothetical protein
MKSTNNRNNIVLGDKKIGKHLKLILQKMCKAVNIKITDIDFFAENWQGQYTWTMKEELEFQAWLKIYLDSNPEAVREITHLKELNRPNFEKLAFYFTLFYGWDLRESDEDLLDTIEENKIN